MMSDAAALTMAMAHFQAGRLDEADSAFRQILTIEPNHAKVWFMLGLLHKQRGQLPEAIDCYYRVLQLRPDSIETYNNLGNALRAQRRFSEAVSVFRQVLLGHPEFAWAHYNLGNALKSLGEQKSALEAYRRAWQLNPDSVTFLSTLIRQMQLDCCWDGLDQLASRLIESSDHQSEANPGQLITPFSFLCLPVPTTARQQWRCARRWAQARFGESNQRVALVDRSTRMRKGGRIRLGYLSADFCSHATAWLIAELLEAHDRNRFEVFGYSIGLDDASSIRRRLVSGCDRFRDLQPLAFRDAAMHIAADEIDILVDLKGYTQDARTEIVALRPAPITVSYLGYPGTMGADFVDYLLVDDFVVAADQQACFSEHLVYLPGCYQVNDSHQEIATLSLTRRDCGLPESGFVYCSFNSSYKLTPRMFDIWMRLLQTIPGSVLWLLEPGAASTRENLLGEASIRGVDGERLIFAPYLPHREHLARLALADLFLDSFPVNAHTTASDALRMGLPMVTLAGETFVARVAGSLLRALGLTELIANDFGAYESLARHLAMDPIALKAVREKLRLNREQSHLFQGKIVTRRIEQAYESMWTRFQSGEAAQSFRVVDA